MTTMIQMTDPDRYNRLITRRPMLDSAEAARVLSLADWLRERQARHVCRAAKPEMDTASAESLTDRCLAYLAGNAPVTARMMADAFGLHRSLVTTSLFRLEQRGAVVSEKAALPSGRIVNLYSLPGVT